MDFQLKAGRKLHILTTKTKINEEQTTAVHYIFVYALSCPIIRTAACLSLPETGHTNQLLLTYGKTRTTTAKPPQHRYKHRQQKIRLSEESPQDFYPSAYSLIVIRCKIDGKINLYPTNYQIFLQKYLAESLLRTTFTHQIIIKGRFYKLD